MIRDSQLTLTTASLLCPHLKPGLDASFFQQFVGKTKTQVQDLLACLGKVTTRPEPDRVRRLPDRARVMQPTLDLARRKDPSQRKAKPAAKAEVKREKRFQFTFTAGEELQQKLARVRDLLSNRFPEGRLEHILDEVVTHYLNATLPGPGKISKPKATDRRYVSKDLKREVLHRACSFIGTHNAKE